MERWAVLVWNMALMSPGARNAEENMMYLAELVEEHSVKVALLNEASVYSLKVANADAIRHGLPEPAAFSVEGTMGRDHWSLSEISPIFSDPD